MGRVLSFEDFGFITLINTIWFIVGNFYNGLYLTVSHRVAFLMAHENKSSEALSFFNFTKKQSIKVSIIVTIIWLLASSYLASFFRISSPISLFLISPIFILGIIYSVNKGYLHGNINFWEVGLLLLLEAISKLLFAFIFLSTNLKELVYLTIPISVFLIYIFSGIFIKKVIKKIPTEAISSFPKQFLFASILISLSGTLFLSWDLIMVKHYLNSSDAGMYAILNLVGKIVFFLATLSSAFIIPLVGRNEGKGLDSKSIFNWSIFLTLFFSLISYLLLGPYGKVIVPFLLGDKALLITTYLNNYVISFVFFSLSYTLTLFHLAKKHYIFAVNAIFAPILFTLGIIFFHEDIAQIVWLILIVSIINILVAVFLHVIYKSRNPLLRNLIKFIRIYSPLPKVSVNTDKVLNR